MPQLKFFIENSQNPFAQYLAASAMKSMLTDCWHKVPLQEKVNIKNYLVNYLMSENVVLKRSPQEQQVVKMMMLLLAKIAKLGWFDDPDIKNGLVP